MTGKFLLKHEHELTLSSKEIVTLYLHAASHRDAACQKLTQRGGLIHDFATRAGSDNYLTVALTRSQLESLRAAIDAPATDLAEILRSALDAALLENPLETFLNELAIAVVHAENDQDREDVATSIAEFMESHDMDAARLRALLAEDSGDVSSTVGAAPPSSEQLVDRHTDHQ